MSNFKAALREKIDRDKATSENISLEGVRRMYESIISKQYGTPDLNEILKILEADGIELDKYELDWLQNQVMLDSIVFYDEPVDDELTGTTESLGEEEYESESLAEILLEVSEQTDLESFEDETQHIEEELRGYSEHIIEELEKLFD